jgi:hypothetical protein
MRQAVLTQGRIVTGEIQHQCAFGWLAHSRNSRLRLFTEDTQI